MKKLISCLLVVMMLFTAATSFAEAIKPVEKSNVLTKFLDETDLNTKDLALQVQSGDEVDDFVIRLDGDNLHLATRKNGTVSAHIQFNSTGMYLGAGDSVTLLRYATVTTVLQDALKALDAVLEEAIDSIPEQQVLSEAEAKEAVNQLAALASAAAAQEEADAATLSSAAMAFADKFKPEYILDVKEEYGVLAISLRSEAFATALAEAVDELMSNPALAELVDRQAAEKGGKTFAEIQLEWLENREATLEAIRTIKSAEAIDENGHWVSHFQIGEENSAVKILVCDMDSWIDAANSEFETIVCLGFQNEEPLMVYEFAVNPYQYWEKLTAGDSFAEINCEIQNNRLSSGKVITVLEGKEELRADFGPDYLYIKGPKGGISTSVRETWTGKIRYELVAENVKGEEASVIVDFYQEDDSLISELYTNKSDRTVMFKISRIDKANIEDLSASEKITEITVEDINALLNGLLKLVAPAKTAAPEAGK
ncbi:MAG: hypothetical protein IK099_10940 [Clostridia bacterium]|nr:hypothetical protein [Clostridia bacterium]